MSRHHILPPLIYTPPPPKPKETRRKRGVHGAASADDVDETGETAAPAPARNTASSRLNVPVEATERRTPSSNGNLSADTLKALLTAQEQEGGEAADPSASKA